MTEEDPQQLLSFACALKHRYGDEPVHLVSVVNDDAGKTADSRSDADAYLKRIAEQEPGNTAMRMAVYEGSDVSAGVVQSARETDTDLLVMGWDAVCAADRSTFGRTVDAVLAQLPLPVYLCRIGQGLSEITHIHFVIPWEIDHHQGFYEAIYNAKQLAAELDVGITVYTYGEHAHRYRQLFDLVEIDIKAEFKLTSSWSDLQSEFALHLQSTDFVITLAVREGEIGWDDELWTFPTHYADVAAQSYALFFLREDDRKHDDQFLRTN
ncbi:universal stress protein [Natronorubrum bangense]|nr:universal stress protein [Natronorubrum bangense]